jgi:hypothetical protein
MSQEPGLTIEGAYKPEPLVWNKISDLRGYLKGNTLFPSRTLMTPKEAKRTDDALTELERAKVVQENLERMASEEEGGMENLLLNESLGGNAGQFGCLPCGGANFRYNAETGRILYFGNSQETPEDIILNSAEGIFRVPVDLRISSPVGVLETYLYGGASENAKKAIEETVLEYNARSGGRIKNPIFRIINRRGR